MRFENTDGRCAIIHPNVPRYTKERYAPTTSAIPKTFEAGVAEANIPETREDIERVTEAIKKDTTTDTCSRGVALHSILQCRKCRVADVRKGLSFNLGRSHPLQNNNKDRLQEIMLIEISRRNSSVILFLS
jgi:hypothetical protein